MRNREDLTIDLTDNLVTQSQGLPFRDFIAISKWVPYLLSFDLILSDQHFLPVSDVPIRLRPFLPKHARHLMLSSRHSFSFEWLGEDWLDTNDTIPREGLWSRVAAHRSTPGTCACRSVSGACVVERCSPRSASFPPQPPPKVALLCSAGSRVLRRSPTAPERACPPFGLWPSRTGLAVEAKTSRSPLGSRACCFSACAGSNDYAGPSNPLAFNVAVRVAFLLSGWSRRPETRVFRSSIAPPTDASIYASIGTSRCRPQDSRSGWIRYSPFP